MRDEQVFILDNIGDMYQFLAGGTVAYSLTSAVAMGQGLSEAVNALAVTDLALLGSASVVTGAVAALGAALTRPHMVSMLADLIATLQTLWLLFPDTRRASMPAADVRPAPKPGSTSCAAQYRLRKVVLFTCRRRRLKAGTPRRRRRALSRPQRRPSYPASSPRRRHHPAMLSCRRTS